MTLKQLKQKALKQMHTEFVKAHKATGIAPYDADWPRGDREKEWSKWLDKLGKQWFEFLRNDARLEARWNIYFGKMTPKQWKAWCAKNDAMTKEQQDRHAVTLARRWEREMEAARDAPIPSNTH